MPQDKQTLIVLKKAGTSILQGPIAEMKTTYICAALSELHRLLTSAKKVVSIRDSAASNQEFTKRFSKQDSTIKLSRKNIFLCLKKLEYYLSWMKSNGAEFI